MKIYKKRAAFALAAAILVMSLCGCGGKQEREKITIWTSGEDYKNEYYLTECQKKFPDYEIVLEYMNTSTIAAKVIEEGENCSCDIISKTSMEAPVSLAARMPPDSIHRLYWHQDNVSFSIIKGRNAPKRKG